MLVLTRKRGEQILIGDDIVITILDAKGDNIRVGIDAPRGVIVHRLEVMKAVTDANVEASRAAASDGDTLAGLLAGMPKKTAEEPQKEA